jgi:hypothetical protein
MAEAIGPGLVHWLQALEPVTNPRALGAIPMYTRREIMKRAAAIPLVRERSALS